MINRDHRFRSVCLQQEISRACVIKIERQVLLAGTMFPQAHSVGQKIRSSSLQIKYSNLYIVTEYKVTIISVVEFRISFGWGFRVNLLMKIKRCDKLEGKQPLQGIFLQRNYDTLPLFQTMYLDIYHALYVTVILLYFEKCVIRIFFYLFLSPLTYPRYKTVLKCCIVTCSVKLQICK